MYNGWHEAMHQLDWGGSKQLFVAFWAIRMTMEKAIYITRCDIGSYSRNANAYRKPLEVATTHSTTLCVTESCSMPQEIQEKCVEIVRFQHIGDLLSPKFSSRMDWDNARVFTGFDFPSMFVAWRLKQRYGCPWTVFLWDPPSLSHRDGFPPLRWAIDAVFRFFAKRCDRLVLNIHPGLLDEIGFRPRAGQLELRMQDAWEEFDINSFERTRHVDEVKFNYDFGVLANWSNAKGGNLMTEAMGLMPEKKCLWIGDMPNDGRVHDGIDFAGRLPQDEAFDRLRKCRVLIVPYLATRAFKWNYPLKLFEYLQLERPILASDNPGNAAIAKRFCGRITLFNSGDTHDLVKKAIECLELPASSSSPRYATESPAIISS